MSSSTASPVTSSRLLTDFSQTEIKMTKTNFNRMIMNYLTSQGYPRAAHNFATEANLGRSSDDTFVLARVDIRDSIHSGKIENAIEMINELQPQLLEEDPSLHFALLRLQLVELIRTATATDDGDIQPALDFATTFLAPRAPTDPGFLSDLERTMALLIFPTQSLTPQLAALLQPSLRQGVARRVNEALLESHGQLARSALFDLLNMRAWAQQKALSMRRDISPSQLSLGLDVDPPFSSLKSSYHSDVQDGEDEQMIT